MFHGYIGNKVKLSLNRDVDILPMMRYNRNKKIECKIYLLSKEEYLVVITKFENDLLSCRMLETNEELVINVHEIDEITIEKIN